MARIPYVSPEDLPEERRDAVNSEEFRDGGPLHLLQVMAHNPLLMDERGTYSRTVRNDSGLPTRQRELVILTIARRLGSAYEWHQHVQFALDDLVSADEIRAISEGDLDAFEGQERALLEYAGAFVEMDVDDEIHENLASFFDTSTIVGIAFLAMEYTGLAHWIDAFDLDVEDEFVGWELEGI